MDTAGAVPPVMSPPPVPPSSSGSGSAAQPDVAASTTTTSSPPAAATTPAHGDPSANIAAGLTQCMAIMASLATQFTEHKSAIDERLSSADAKLEQTNLQVASLAHHADDVDERIHHLGAGVDRVSHGQDELWTEFNKLKARMGIAESATSPTVIINHDEFERAPDLTIIKCNTAEPILKQAFIEATEEWLGRMHLDNSDNKFYTITGKEKDKFFDIRFHGPPATAAPLVAAAMRYQRVDGRYVDIYADKPLDKDGIATGTTRVYVNMDKSPKQSKSELLTRNLGRQLLEIYPGRIAWNRRDAVVLMDAMPLCQVQLLSADQPPIVKWDYNVIGQLNAGNHIKTTEGRAALTDALATTTGTRRIETSHFRV